MIRTDLLSLQSPNRGGVSQTLKIALIGDPCFELAMAPALYWARTLWMSANSPALSTTPLPQVLSWWRQADKSTGGT